MEQILEIFILKCLANFLSFKLDLVSGTAAPKLISRPFRQKSSQTPQRTFTVDSLKDADLRKDVPFGSR